MRLRLERIGERDKATWGFLHVGLETLVTIEPVWNDNVPGESCVPPGFYALEGHHSDEFPDTFALVGEDVSHWPQKDCERNAILIHPGNWRGQTRGCILPGMSITKVSTSLGVSDSVRAMDIIRKALERDARHYLIIEDPH